MEKIVNLILKSISLLAKFVFILIAGREISEVDFGNYALFSALIMYVSGLIGCEYHAYSNRALLVSSGAKRKLISTNQVGFVIFALTFCMPILFILAKIGVIPAGLEWWFVLLLVLEYVSLEMIRLLNILDNQIKSTIVYSAKTSCWMLPMAFFWLAGYHFDTNDLYEYWCYFSLVSVILGLFFLKSHLKRGIRLRLFNFSYIKQGVVNSKDILLSSQVSLLIFVLDRYILNYTAGIESVSSYFFFFMLTSSLLSVLESSVFVFAIPELIRKVNQGYGKEIKIALNKMIKVTMTAACIGSLVMFLVVEPIIEFVGKDTFKSHKVVFYLLILFVVIRVYSLSFHHVLYAAKQDRKLMWINVASLFLFFIFYFSVLTLGIEPINVMAMNMVVISCFHVVVKRYFVNKMIKCCK